MKILDSIVCVIVYLFRNFTFMTQQEKKCLLT